MKSRAILVLGPALLLAVPAAAGCSGGTAEPPADSGGAGATGAAAAGSSSGAAVGAGGTGGATFAGSAGASSGGGAAGGAAGASAAGTGPSGGAGGAVAAGGAAGAGAGAGGESAGAGLSTTPGRMMWTAVRHHSGTTPNGRTNGPTQGPEQALVVHNGGAAALTLSLSLTGPGASRFRITSPSGALQLEPGADAEVRLALTTSSDELGAPPAQDDGATALSAALELSAGGKTLSIPSYALVLTYVELEPTFGQILRAFPEYTTKLPSWLPDDANPNPPQLPGVVAGTDEVSAPAFERMDPQKPVVMRALARFSPPGLVPFGWYDPASPGARTTVATLAELKDAQTNDKSRMLEPPLASGSTTFTPSADRFGIWMTPAGVGLLASEDASCFDGKHRVRTWSVRDAQGVVRPGTFLIGGEEAANGDYQDYVFLLENVRPAP
ncbi:MAG: hypothetical protein EOO73_10130 [Myxococcales bacterium]|nr:MAG: hypothetical protein EOO73_10130 [Myxococcales bacterium]